MADTWTFGGLFGTGAYAYADGDSPVWSAALRRYVPTAISGGGTGDVVGPASAVDDQIATFDGTTGKLIQDGGSKISDVITAAVAASGDVDGPGSSTDDHVALFNGATGKIIKDSGDTISDIISDAMIATEAIILPIDLTADVTGDLPLSNLAQSSAASRLLLRGSASGAGDWQEGTVGSGLALTGTVLSATGGSGGVGDVVGPSSAGDAQLALFDSTTGKLIKDSRFTVSDLVAETVGAAYDLILPLEYESVYTRGMGPIFPLTPPVDNDFAWINQGSATTDQYGPGIYLSCPANASLSWRIRKKAAPSTPYTVTMMMLPFVGSGPGGRACLLFRQASDGKLVVLSWDTVNGYGGITVENYTNETTFSSTVVTRFGPGIQGPVFFRIEDDGTNRKQHVSPDGVRWIQLNSISRTNFMTATEIGFAVSEQSNLRAAGATILSWREN